MNSSSEPQITPPTNPRESDPAFQQVTIPYFLYEAMARAYYSHDKNVDLPMPEPSKMGGSINFEGVQFNPIDVPPNWKPGGVAAKDHRHVAAPIQTPEE